jgi:DNA polymerase sigma
MDKQQDGTLPAYSYSLMVIYFLQRSKPHMLPILQDLLPKGVETRPELLIEGKDCWFYDDLANLVRFHSY